MPRQPKHNSPIAQIREFLGLSQEELGKKLGFASRSAIQQIEAGKQKPPPQLIEALRDLSGIVIPLDDNGEIPLDYTIPPEEFEPTVSSAEAEVAEADDLERVNDLAKAAPEIIRLISLAALDKGRFKLFFHNLENFLTNFIKQEQLKPNLLLALRKWHRKTSSDDISATETDPWQLIPAALLTAGAMLESKYQYGELAHLLELKKSLLELLASEKLPENKTAVFEAALTECESLIAEAP